MKRSEADRGPIIRAALGLVAVLLSALLVVMVTTGGWSPTETGEETKLRQAVEFHDPDSDGYSSSVTVRIDSTEVAVAGNGQTERYLKLSIGNNLIREVSFSADTDVIDFYWNVFDGYDRGEFTVTVSLHNPEADGSGTEPGAQLAKTTRTVRIEPGSEEGVLLAALSRDRTIVRSPVSLVSNRQATWEISSRPEGSSAQLRQRKAVVTFDPDVVGRYEFTATSIGGDSSETVSLNVSADPNRSMVERYSPVLSFASETAYWPTRFETAVHQASLVDDDGIVAQNPTMLDLADRAADSRLRLEGGVTGLASPGVYPYDGYGYPPSVYASVHDTTYKGTRYTAVTYWLFYIFDPKVPGLGSLLGHHADLESVTILVNEDGPQWIGVSQHFGGEVREWSHTPREGTHPVIYPAIGSHANFLYDTSRTKGDGFLPQAQYADERIRSTRIVGPSLYAERTGSAIYWRHTGPADERYELVTVTGDESWASYRGSLSKELRETQVPQKTSRWADFGQWFERVLVPDEKQARATLDLDHVGVSKDQLSIETRVTNTGPSPMDIVVTLLADPENCEGDTFEVGETQIPLGTRSTDQVNVSGTPPPGEGIWGLRVVVSRYAWDEAGTNQLAYEQRPRAIGWVKGDLVKLRAELVSTEGRLSPNGTTVVPINRADLPAGGFLVVMEGDLSGQSPTRYGVSNYLTPGTHRDVAVPLSKEPEGPGDVLVVAYIDIDGDGTFDPDIDRRYLEPSGEPTVAYTYLRE